MKRPLLIALGNRWRGDDALGLLVLDQLLDQLPAQLPGSVLRSLETMENPADTLSLINAWSQRQNVYLIDCCCDTRLPAGTVIVIKNALQQETVLQTLGQPASSHLLDIRQAIALSRATGNLPQQLSIYSAVGKQFTPGNQADPAILIAAQEITKKLSAELSALETFSPTILPGDSISSKTGTDTG